MFISMRLLQGEVQVTGQLPQSPDNPFGGTTTILKAQSFSEFFGK